MVRLLTIVADDRTIGNNNLPATDFDRTITHNQ